MQDETKNEHDSRKKLSIFRNGEREGGVIETNAAQEDEGETQSGIEVDYLYCRAL